MTTTTVFEPLLEENFQQLTTPNYQVFQTVAAARLGAWDATKSDSPVCYVEEKEAFYNYCSACGLPDDGDLVLTTSDGGTTRWEMVQKVSRTQGDNGWIDRNGLTVSKLNSTTLRANLTSNAYYAVNSTRVTLAAGDYDISFTGTARTIAVFFNASGTLSQSNNVPAELFTSTPAAVVYWTGTQIGGIQTEFHGIRDTVWHAWAHKYLGTQYDSGLAITTNTQPDSSADPAVDTVQYLWLTTGTIFDEDTAIAIGTGNWLQTLGSGLTNTTAAVIPFFYYNATAGAVIGVAANANREPFLFTGANGYPQRENNGVLTAGANGEYITYHYFASPFIDGYSVFARPHNNTTAFSTLLAAQSARPSSLTWSAIGEFKHIYSVVFRLGNWGNTPTHNAKIVSVQDFRLVSSGPASGTNASAHGSLSGLADAGAHPATAIAPDTTNFNGEFSALDTTLQLVLDRVDDFDSLLDWGTGKAYRVGNVVRITTEGFVGEWRCVTAHTAAAAVTTDFNLGYWEIVANSEGSRELINATSHGFVAGTPLARVGGAWVAAHCMDDTYAEVQAIVAGVTTNYFVAVKTGKLTITGDAWPLEAGNGPLVDNTTYWLAATAGKITATKPTTVGYIEKPIINSAGTTSGNTTLSMRGTTVGGTNLYTPIPLNNGTATTILNLSDDTMFPVGSCGELTGGECNILQTGVNTDYIFGFKLLWAKTASNVVNIQPDAMADVPPGFAFGTSGANIQVSFTALANFESGKVRYAMNAAPVGAQLPLQIDGSRVNGPVLGSTSGTAIPAGMVGEKITWSTPPSTATFTALADWTNAALPLTTGVWHVFANISWTLQTGTTAANYQILGLGIYNSSNTLLESSDRSGILQTPAAAAASLTSSISFSFPLILAANTTIKIRASGGGIGAGITTVRNEAAYGSNFYAIRIA